MMYLSKLQLEEIVKQLLDITEENSVLNCFYDNNDKFISAYIVSDQDVILFGTLVVEAVFKIIDPNIKVNFFYKDGDFVGRASSVMKISGSLASIYRVEKIVLGIISRMSNISTCFFL